MHTPNLTEQMVICQHISFHGHTQWDCVSEKGPNACFFKISIFLYSRSLKCPLHIASYALRIGVSVMEL